jgi:hypothetical protein
MSEGQFRWLNDDELIELGVQLEVERAALAVELTALERELTEFRTRLIKPGLKLGVERRFRDRWHSISPDHLVLVVCGYRRGLIHDWMGFFGV